MVKLVAVLVRLQFFHCGCGKVNIIYFARAQLVFLQTYFPACVEGHSIDVVHAVLHPRVGTSIVRMLPVCVCVRVWVCVCVYVRTYIHTVQHTQAYTDSKCMHMRADM